MFDFCEQKMVGDKGESLFLKAYSDRLPIKADGRIFDFYIDDEKTVELKTDTYSVQDTENFFIERYSCYAKKTPGGPWRAMYDKVDYFVYLFLPDRIFYWFEPSDLCRQIDSKIKPKYIFKIRNAGWDTAGYKIRRRDLNFIERWVFQSWTRI